LFPGARYMNLGRFSRGHVIRRVRASATGSLFGLAAELGLRLCPRSDATRPNFLSGVSLLGTLATPFLGLITDGVRLRLNAAGIMQLDAEFWVPVVAEESFLIAANVVGSSGLVHWVVSVFAEWHGDSEQSAFSPRATGGFAGSVSVRRPGES